MLQFYNEIGDFDEHDPHWPKDGVRLGCYLRKHRDWFAGVGIEYQYFREEYRRIHGFRKAAGSELYVPNTAVPDTDPQPAPAVPTKPAPPTEASRASTVANVEPA